MGPIVMAIPWSAVVRVTIASLTLQHIWVQRVHIKLQDVFAVSFSLLRAAQRID